MAVMTSLSTPERRLAPDAVARPRWWHRSIGLAVAAGMVVTLTAGCGQPRSAAAPMRTPSPSRAASAVSSGRPQAVAAAFFRTWGSYDAIHDGPDAFVARCRPLVTARLARDLADDQPASADWAGKHRRHEVSVIRVASLRQPDGAPDPSLRRVYFRVYGDRITTNVDGRHVTPTGVTLVLVHRGRRWLVDRVLFV